MHHKKTTLLLPAVILTLALGCEKTHSAMDKTTGFVTGSAKATVLATPKQAIAAAATALKELDLPVDAQSATALDGQLTSHTAADKKITVSTKSLTDTESQLTVKIGSAFGDKDLATRILNQITKHVTVKPTTQPTTQPNNGE